MSFSSGGSASGRSGSRVLAGGRYFGPGFRLLVSRCRCVKREPPGPAASALVYGRPSKSGMLESCPLGASYSPAVAPPRDRQNLAGFGPVEPSSVAKRRDRCHLRRGTVMAHDSNIPESFQGIAASPCPRPPGRWRPRPCSAGLAMPELRRRRRTGTGEPFTGPRIRRAGVPCQAGFQAPGGPGWLGLGACARRAWPPQARAL